MKMLKLQSNMPLSALSIRINAYVIHRLFKNSNLYLTHELTS